MSEENTSVEETAAEAPEGSAPQLGVADLKLAASIIEIVSNRGAIKAAEMEAVGMLYNKLMAFLIANGAVEIPSQEAPVDDAEAPAEEETND